MKRALQFGKRFAISSARQTAKARSCFPCQSPTGARKSAHRPSRLPPNHAKRAVDFRRSLQMLHCRAGLPRRTAATAAFSKAADEAGLAHGTTEMVGPIEMIGAIVADGFDKTSASIGKAAVIP